MKTKGQREQLLGGSEFRWPVFLGLTMAWRSLLTEIPAEGSIPSSSTVLNPPRKRLEPPTGIVLGYEDRVWKPAVHFGSAHPKKARPK